MTPARRVAEVLRRTRREDARRTRQIREAVVDGRNTDGTLRLTHLDGTCTLTGEIGPEGRGDVISLPTGPLANRGTTGVAGISLHRETATIWVERLDPDTYAPGEAYTVDVIGRGFSEATVFDFLRPGTEEVNPDITIVEQRFITAQLVELDITVAAGAQIFAAAPIAYDDPTIIN
jgi:hypothetical protein